MSLTAHVAHPTNADPRQDLTDQGNSFDWALSRRVLAQSRTGEQAIVNAVQSSQATHRSAFQMPTLLYPSAEPASIAHPDADDPPAVFGPAVYGRAAPPPMPQPRPDVARPKAIDTVPQISAATNAKALVTPFALRIKALQAADPEQFQGMLADIAAKSAAETKLNPHTEAKVEGLLQIWAIYAHTVAPHIPAEHRWLSAYVVEWALPMLRFRV